jgi:DNA repair exonuclease SbcCD ATPase subunit
LAKIELHRTIAEQVKDMKARLLEMKAQLKDEPALKYLVQGYQDKNIKKMAIEAISQHLMALVNRYAQRIMPERFTFEFKWDTQIHILVHRHYGQKVKTSDVRKLSGAESTLFTLILVCALLAFVPSYKRCNLMILDEPTARFSPAMTDVFKNLLQILNQIVPSIVVITPKSDERYADAKPYTVVKQNGESTIVQGYPDEVKDQTKSVTE